MTTDAPPAADPVTSATARLQAARRKDTDTAQKTLREYVALLAGGQDLGAKQLAALDQALKDLDAGPEHLAPLVAAHRDHARLTAADAEHGRLVAAALDGLEALVKERDRLKDEVTKLSTDIALRNARVASPNAYGTAIRDLEKAHPRLFGAWPPPAPAAGPAPINIPRLG